MRVTVTMTTATGIVMVGIVMVVLATIRTSEGMMLMRFRVVLTVLCLRRTFHR